MDNELGLFDRYRAMFALRDMVPSEGEAAVVALCEAFSDDCALLKHELAFVLGQVEVLHFICMPTSSEKCSLLLWEGLIDPLEEGS